MALVKVAHPKVPGNDSGFMMIDHENLTSEHEVLDGYTPEGEVFDIEKLFQLALKVRTQVGALTIDQRQEFEERFEKWRAENPDADLDGERRNQDRTETETPEARKARLKAEKASGEAGSPGVVVPGQEIPNGGEKAPGWVQPDGGAS